MGQEKCPRRCAGRVPGLFNPNEAEGEDVDHENAQKEMRLTTCRFKGGQEGKTSADSVWIVVGGCGDTHTLGTNQ